MANVNVRLDEELNQKLRNIVLEIKQEAPEGSEVTITTVVKKAINNFINEIKKNKLVFDLEDLNNKEFEVAENIIKQLYDVVPKANWKDSEGSKAIEMINDNFIDLLESIIKIKAKKQYEDTLNKYVEDRL